MFYSANIQIDPTQMTQIRSIPNDSLFKNLKNILSFGNKSDKFEQETFTAISIMQEIKNGLNNIGVDNVIKLSVDDFDYYFDNDSVDDDLEFAISNLKYKIDPLSSKLFEKIHLVLEHIDNDFKYYIDIAVYRKHKVNEYPIKINVFGFFSEFNTQKLDKNIADKQNENLTENNEESNQDVDYLEGLRTKLDLLFANSDYYEGYTKHKQQVFEDFVNKLYFNLGKMIKVDAIRKYIIAGLLRPNSSKYTINEIKEKELYTDNEYAYKGVFDYTLYLWLWSEYLFKYDIYTYNTLLIDEKGNKIIKIGQMGFLPASYTTLNPDAEFMPVKGAFIKYYPNNIYSESLEKSGLLKYQSNELKSENKQEWLRGVVDENELNNNNTKKSNSK